MCVLAFYSIPDMIIVSGASKARRFPGALYGRAAALAGKGSKNEEEWMDE